MLINLPTHLANILSNLFWKDLIVESLHSFATDCQVISSNCARVFGKNSCSNFFSNYFAQLFSIGI